MRSKSKSAHISDFTVEKMDVTSVLAAGQAWPLMGSGLQSGFVFFKKETDNGWPESAEEQATLVLLEVVHKRTVVNVLLLIHLMNRKEMRR